MTSYSSEASQAIMWVKLKDISGEHTLKMGLDFA